MRSIENSANPKVQNAARLSQFFEILCLLCSVLVFCGYLLIADPFRFWSWTIACLIGTVIFLLLAIRYQILAISAYRKARFNFSEQRLHTLKVLKTPEDVMMHLETLRGKRILGEGELFAKLDALMGRERCAEIRTTVFKYTKVD